MSRRSSFSFAGSAEARRSPSQPEREVGLSGIRLPEDTGNALDRARVTASSAHLSQLFPAGSGRGETRTDIRPESGSSGGRVSPIARCRVIRAAIALEIGRLKAVDVVPMAEDARSVLLVLTGEAGRVTHEVHADDLWPIAMACRNAVQKAKAVTV